MTKQTSFAAGLNDAVRENPIAAALVGAGVCWMLFGSKVPALASAVPDAAKSVGQSLSSAGYAASDAVGEAAGNVKRQVTDAIDRTTHAARELVGTSDTVSKTDTGDKVAEIGREFIQSGQRYASAAQQRLAESLERQPLLLGALGIAIGAGIASAFPSTTLETELMGKHGTAAREKLETLVEEGKSFAVKRGQEVLDDVQREAAAQGLTPEHAKQSLREFSGKVKNVAGATREAVVNRVS
jgi:hypothetical protein